MRIAIITGGSRGIGKAVALELLKEGYTVVITSRNLKQLKETENELKKYGNIEGIKNNVYNYDDVKELIKTVYKKFGRIDILINNAGVAIWKELDQMNKKEIDDILDINLKGLTYMCREVIPIMKKQKSGKIINISSGAGKQGYASFAVYCASKFGVIGLSDSLAKELEKDGIGVYTICPGGVNTKMYLDMEPEADPDSLLQPEQIAEKIIACVKGKHKNGACIEVYN